MKRPVSLLVIFLLVFSLSAALAQTASSVTGGFSVTLPDHFVEESLASSPDPDLCFYWHGNKLSIQGYASYQGEVSLFDLPQVLTGDETESGTVTINGMAMLFSRTDSGSEVCISYSWMDRGNLVTLYFTFGADDPSTLNTVNRVINSITFDPGH